MTPRCDGGAECRRRNGRPIGRLGERGPPARKVDEAGGPPALRGRPAGYLPRATIRVNSAGVRGMTERRL